MLKRWKHTILRWSLEQIVGSIDPWKVFTCDERTGVLKLNGEQLADSEVKELKAEVDVFTRFKLWGIFHETLRQKAIEKAVLHSTDFEQVLTGKLMLLNLSVMKTIMDLIQKAKVHSQNN